MGNTKTLCLHYAAKLFPPLVALGLLVGSPLSYGFGNCSTICINGNCTSDCTDGDQVISGSDKLITKHYALPPVDSVKADGVMDVNVAQGNVQRVEITVNENLVDRLDVSASDGELSIRLKESQIQNLHLKAKVVIEKLRSVTVDGVTNLEFDGFDSDKLAIAINGSSTVTGRKSRVGNIHLAARGNSQAYLQQVEAARAQVDIDGVSHTALRLPDSGGELSGQISGVSTVEYCGQVARDSLRLEGVSSIAKSAHCL